MSIRLTTWQPRDTRIDNGNAKPEGWISPEEQGRRDYDEFWTCLATDEQRRQHLTTIRETLGNRSKG